MPVSTRNQADHPRRFAVIMAGGESTRLWPLSRTRRPKPFLALGSSRSLLRATAERGRRLVGWRNLLVVGHAQHRRLLRQQLPEVPAEQILTEPLSRNTAPCLRLAAEWLIARHGDATMLAFPADHLIRDDDGFARSLGAAAEVAERTASLVVLGVPPSRVDTGYGHIRLGERLKGAGPGAHVVQRFIEKPPLARARRLMARGQCLWNAGMFVWRVSDFVAALEQCAPEYNRAFEGLFGAAQGARRRLQAVYETVPARAIDVALLQPLTAARRRSREVAVVPASFDWDDIGSWDRVAAVWGTDAGHNTPVGEVLLVDSSDCVVHSEDHRTVVLGAQGLVVVHRGDVTLIVPKERAQEVRKLPALLRARGWGVCT